jgi:DNA-binding transcriptional MerR regulator
MPGQLLQIGEAAKVLDISRATLGTWLRRGVLPEPKMKSRGKKRNRLFSLSEIFAIEIGKCLRKSGHSLAAAEAAAALIGSFTDEQLDLLFASGRHCIFLAGDQVASALFREDEFDAKQIRQMAKQAKENGIDLGQPTFIRLSMSWRQVKKRIDDLISVED